MKQDNKEEACCGCNVNDRFYKCPPNFINKDGLCPCSSCLLKMICLIICPDFKEFLRRCKREES